MTSIFITFDTELSPGAHLRGVAPKANLAQSIFGTCGDGTFGIAHQMQRLDAYGLKGVFFVDPIPAQVFGLDIVKRIVQPILDGGHEVQLHLHTEWLPHMAFDPVDGRRGQNIADFSYSDQVILLELAEELLVAAGAPSPVAFRAGNYGADDNTLRALKKLGICYDSSFNPSYLGDTCRISLPADTVMPTEHEGVMEVPISCIMDRPGSLRHAQLCALSAWEMREGLQHAVAAKQQFFTIVSHSFELLSRDRMRANRKIVDRFEALCAFVGDPGNSMRAKTYGDVNPSEIGQASNANRLQPNLLRTVHRIGEQLMSTLRYERPAGQPVKVAS